MGLLKNKLSTSLFNSPQSEFSASFKTKLFAYSDLITYSHQKKHKLLKYFIKKILLISKPKILFIFGIQRSGTSITFRTLDQLKGVKGYGEFSELTKDGDEKLRFPSFKKIKTIINKNIEPFIIIKPIVESQNADTILSYFSNSIGIWMYRDYKSVIRSFNELFGETSGKEHLKLVFENNTTNWRSERVPKQLREEALKYFNPDITNEDATALYWYIRNKMYFYLSFDKMERLKLLKYEYLMNESIPVMHKLLAFWEYPYDLKKEIIEFNTNSISKGQNIKLSPNIENLCQSLLKKMDTHFYSQNTFIL